MIVRHWCVQRIWRPCTCFLLLQINILLQELPLPLMFRFVLVWYCNEWLTLICFYTLSSNCGPIGLRCRRKCVTPVSLLSDSVFGSVQVWRITWQWRGQTSSAWWSSALRFSSSLRSVSDGRSIRIIHPCSSSLWCWSTALNMVWKVRVNVDLGYGTWFIYGEILTVPVFLLAARKSFIGQSKSIWAPLESIEKICPESADIATSVRDMPGLK